MKVLVTGSTGYIGGAVAAAVQLANHEVYGPAHADEAAARNELQGWRAERGDIRDAALRRARCVRRALTEDTVSKSADPVRQVLEPVEERT